MQSHKLGCKALIGTLMFCISLSSGVATAQYPQDRAELRVGRAYYARPGITDTSVEFYADLNLRKRLPVYKKTRFVIEGIDLTGPWPGTDPVYRVAFADERVGYIDVADFEKRLYRELLPNQVANSPQFQPPGGRGVQVYTFERSSIFAGDPDVIWSRVRNQGPRTLSPGPGFGPGRVVPQPGQPAQINPTDPTDPVIAPR